MGLKSILQFSVFMFVLGGYAQDSVTNTQAEKDILDTTEIIAAADTGFVDDIEDGQDIPIANYQYVPEVTDEIIIDRMSCIEGDIKLKYNPKINSFIDFYVRRRREYALLMLQRKNLYFPVFEAALQKYNMPDELKYLAIVESGLKPNALSPSNALGLWQFIPSTGKMYNLKIDSYIDERLDPYKSSEAACKYLKWLYNAFGDWHLALASYNCGPGYVKRAVRLARGKNDFWQIYNFLPQETRSYVPQFIAVTYMMSHAEEHNLFPAYCEQAVKTDTVIVNGYCDVNTVALMLNLCPEDLNKINLELKRNVIPGYYKNYILNLPSDKIKEFKANRKKILDSAAILKQTELLARSTRFETQDGYKETTVVGLKKYHKVKKGESLGRIAAKYGVRVSQLKTWNGIAGNKIRLGQKLVIYKKTVKYNPSNNNQPQYAYKNTSKVKKSKKSPSKFYTVQPGDTLWKISQKNGGIPVEKIRKLNKIKGNKINTGQRLIVG